MEGKGKMYGAWNMVPGGQGMRGGCRGSGVEDGHVGMSRGGACKEGEGRMCEEAVQCSAGPIQASASPLPLT